jgi:hypothetical protein
MSNKTVNLVSELDFETIRNNIAAYIANNSSFTDYNYEGSGLSTIMDILAYNTHYNAVYLNMALNENFIDTAQLRSSVVSIARNLGYTPRSKKSAKTKVSFRIPTTDPNNTSLTLEKTTKFVGDIDGSTYIFQPTSAITALSDGSRYTFNNVELREGTRLSIQYDATDADGNLVNRFFINNFNIDTESIEVYNQEAGSNLQTYDLVSDITILDEESQIYYLFESTNKNYVIQFGDGVLGKKPEGGTIIISFQTSSGEAANGISKLTLSDTIGAGRTIGLESFGASDIIFDNIETSYGGASEESIESVRINALTNFSTQGRAVTAEDYRFFLERDYPQAESISVWGGQDNVPPIYGKVFISFKPRKGFRITNAVKQEILSNILETKNILTVIPEIVDADYTFVQISTSVLYNAKRTIYTSAELQSLILDKIMSYNSEELVKFGTRFSYSKFVNEIDRTENSIISNYTLIKLRKNFPVNIDVTNTYTIDFQNPLRAGTFRSATGFRALNDSTLGATNDEFFIEDDSSGLIRIYKIDSGNKVILKTNSGTIDYNTGLVKITNLKPSSVVNIDKTLDVIAEPVEYTVTSRRNNILVIVDTDVNINMRVE